MNSFISNINKLHCLIRKGFFLSIFAFLISFESRCQSKNPSSFLSDFEHFIQKLVSIHPDPYSNFGGQIAFYRKKQEFEKQLENADNSYEFALHLNKFLSELHDGHTFINYPKPKNTNTEKLPFELKASNDQIFIQNTTEPYSEHIGKKVLSINNVSVPELLKKTDKLYPSENISGSYYNLIRTLKSRISSKLLLESTDQLTFILVGTDEPYSLTVSYVSKPDFLLRESKIGNINTNGLLSWKIIGEQTKVGILTWNSILSREVLEEAYQMNPESTNGFLGWAYSFLNTKQPKDPLLAIQKVPAIYEEFSQLIQGMQKANSEFLIIDLRYNSGGWSPILDPLLYMIHGEKFLNFDFEAQYIKRISNNTSSNPRYTFRKFGGLDLKLPPAERKELMEDGHVGFGKKFIENFNSKGFDPTTIVLTSPTTFSAAYHFTYFLKKLGNTYTVGVAPRQAGNSFMETTPIELPKSGLKGSISNAKQVLFKSDEAKGKILTPDFPMDWNDYKEFNFDRNSEVLKALELISSDFQKK